MDEVAKQFEAIMARDGAAKPPTGVSRFADGGAGGGVLTTGKTMADLPKPLQPATTARDRITTSVSELESLIGDIETMIAELIAIRDRL